MEGSRVWRRWKSPGGAIESSYKKSTRSCKREPDRIPIATGRAERTRASVAQAQHAFLLPLHRALR